MQTHTLDDINPYILSCSTVNAGNCPRAGIPYESRIVSWYELELILWGEGYIHTCNSKLIAQKGTIFYRKPGMEVQGIPPYHCYLIVFDPFFNSEKRSLYRENNPLGTVKLIKETSNNTISNTVDPFNLPFLFQTKQFDLFKELFQITYEEFLKSSDYNNTLAMKSYLLQIIHHILGEMVQVQHANYSKRSFISNQPKVMKVKDFIDENYSSPIGLNQLAEIADLSPNFLCKIFKQLVGTTLINYINKQRINFAKKVLIETDSSVKDISYLCGFENENYFYYVFKNYENETPLGYRYRHRIE